jgi:hypothetical protein
MHKRPLLNPDEIGRLLARIDDPRRPGYPGLVLALIPGEHPLLARRVNYFQSPRFLGCFDPHPNHPPPPTLAELASTAWQPALPRPVAPRRVVSTLLIGGGIAIAAVAMLAVALGSLVGGDRNQQHAAPSPAPSPPAQTASAAPAPPPPPVAAPQVSPAYAQGAADWRDLQDWFGTQTGDRRAGADYWAANRSDPKHLSCTEASEQYGDTVQAGMAFEAGCLDAKAHLDPIDARRADPQYTAGFNDEAKHSRSATAGAAHYATVSTVKLNLRTGPGPDYPSVAILPQGTRVKIVGVADSNGWEELEATGDNSQKLRGFSNGKYLTPAQ